MAPTAIPASEVRVMIYSPDDLNIAQLAAVDTIGKTCQVVFKWSKKGVLPRNEAEAHSLLEEGLRKVSARFPGKPLVLFIYAHGSTRGPTVKKGVVYTGAKPIASDIPLKQLILISCSAAQRKLGKPAPFAERLALRVPRVYASPAPAMGSPVLLKVQGKRGDKEVPFFELWSETGRSPLFSMVQLKRVSEGDPDRREYTLPAFVSHKLSKGKGVQFTPSKFAKTNDAALEMLITSDRKEVRRWALEEIRAGRLPFDAEKQLTGWILAVEESRLPAVRHYMELSWTPEQLRTLVKAGAENGNIEALEALKKEGLPIWQEDIHDVIGSAIGLSPAMLTFLGEWASALPCSDAVPAERSSLSEEPPLLFSFPT